MYSRPVTRAELGDRSAPASYGPPLTRPLNYAACTFVYEELNYLIQ